MIIQTGFPFNKNDSSTDYFIPLALLLGTVVFIYVINNRQEKIQDLIIEEKTK